MHLGSYGSLRSLQVFLVVVLLCLLLSATPFLCLYAGPTHSIVLTIVHFDGTPSYPSTVSITNTRKTFLLVYCYIISKLAKSFDFVVKELIKYVFYNCLKAAVICTNFTKGLRAAIVA